MSIEGSPLLTSIEQAPPAKHTFKSLQETAAGDELLEELFQDVKDGAYRYFECVQSHEHLIQVRQFRILPQEYRDLHQQHDHARRIAHNAICDKLRILARAEKKHHRDTAWWTDITGQQENRLAIGRWALRAVFEDLLDRERANDEEKSDE